LLANLVDEAAFMYRSARLIAAAVVALSLFAGAQNSSSTAAGGRKVIMRVEPDYPELARQTHLHGVVKVEAVVGPNGSVKSTRVVGGNPVLVQSAQTAVSKWKFEPASGETTELVELTFSSR
jgi:TonB family protein